MYGGALLDGEGVAKDVARAIPALKRSCDQGIGVGCARVGRAHEDGALGAPDHEAAQKLYERACEYGFDPACKAVPEKPGPKAHEL
jgi:TPR repeat protein